MFSLFNGRKKSLKEHWLGSYESLESSILDCVDSMSRLSESPMDLGQTSWDSYKDPNEEDGPINPLDFL